MSTKPSISAAVPTVAPATAGGLRVVPLARYEGAGQGRRMKNWSAPSTGPITATAPALPTLRNRCRDAVRNYPAAAAIVRNWVSSLVGTGIVARVNSYDPGLREKLTTLWNDWLPSADSAGACGDLFALQTLIAKAYVTDGEVFIRFRARRPSDGLPVPAQIEVLEADLVPLLDRDLPNGNRIRQGIEFDAIGRRVAYWMFREHPGDPRGLFALSDQPQDLIRVPAENISHVFMPDRPGAVRGVPLLAPVLARLKLLDDLVDATSERQRLANLFAMFITRPMPTSGEAAIDPITGKTVQYDGNGAPIAALEPGISQELLPGEEVKFSDPPQVGQEFSEFTRLLCSQIAQGAGGMPTELLSGDLRDISDRSMRLGLQEWRRVVEAQQWQVLIPKMCQPIRAAWAKAAMLGGLLSYDEAVVAMNSEWAPPAWPRIHPTQDVQAEKMEVAEGFRSRASVIASRGYDPVTVDAERAADAAREADLGLQTDDQRLADAQLAKLEAEAKAAEKQAQAAQRAAEAAAAKAKEARAAAAAHEAQARTTEATRTHAVAEAADRARAAKDGARVAALEVEAAKVGLAELRGGAQ